MCFRLAACRRSASCRLYLRAVVCREPSTLSSPSSPPAVTLFLLASGFTAVVFLGGPKSGKILSKCIEKHCLNDEVFLNNAGPKDAAGPCGPSCTGLFWCVWGSQPYRYLSVTRYRLQLFFAKETLHLKPNRKSTSSLECNKIK